MMFIIETHTSKIKWKNKMITKNQVKGSGKNNFTFFPEP